MTQFFHDCLQSKRCLLIVLLALLYSTQTKLEAQNCDPDTLPPIAICDQIAVVAIGTDDPNDCYGPAGPNGEPPALGAMKGAGVTWVKALTLNEGSYDPCGNNIRVTVRRKAPYTNTILGLNTTNGHPVCSDLFPDFPSEFERAISEGDSIKFYAGEVGTTQKVILRVYKLTASGSIAINPFTGLPIYNECEVDVEVTDKIKPVCIAPADVTVTCEQFDPTLLSHGFATATDNACLDTIIATANYSNFDSLCSKGTIFRTFKAYDTSGNSSQCNQRVVANYVQNYFVHFPNDVITNVLDPNNSYGEPTFLGEDCELMGVSYEDVVFTNQPDCNYKIERTWSMINWCTYNIALPSITVPNPTPNAILNHPSNLPGPIVSAPGTPSPWTSTVVKIDPLDPAPTDYSTFWDANANMYRYTQTIKIIDTFFVAIEGKVFSDSSANCAYDNGEGLLGSWTVRATGQTTGQTKEVMTDVDGTYTIIMGGLDTVVTVTLATSGNFGQNCQTNYNVNAQVGQVAVQDIPVHLEQRCALLSVGIATPRLRRCFSSRYITEASNLSGETVTNATVEVNLDDYLDFLSSSIPGTLVSGNTYTFNVGTLNPGDRKRFWIDVNVNCNAPLGITHCTEAKITPFDDCHSNSSWSGADVDVTATCEGDSVRLTLTNIGTAPMAEVLGFVVVEDIIMRQSGSFQLNTGESLNLKYPANGSTWRLEAEEEPAHPFGGPQAVALEGCGGVNQTGLVNLFPVSNNSPFETTDCHQNTGPYDPNDKQAFPTGLGDDHLLHSNTDIEYFIRFQNVGTDTAFTVKVLDTLSQYLVPSTVRIMSSSHPMEFTIINGNVLQFLFDHINLPDSNVSAVASNGFLKFRVAQKQNNPEGTRIENKAAIYFDFNTPIITNTTFHTINDHALSVGVNDPFNTGKGVKVFPNPTADMAVFQFENAINNGYFELKNQIGQIVRNVRFSGNQYQFERAGLTSGIYFFTIRQENGNNFSGKIIVN